ncbi:MAG: hypothetical protein OXM87_01315 [Truepera sp.]|nr:hypothetical protein [Truepera sp.]
MSEVFELNHSCLFRSAHATESSVPVGLGHPPHTLSLAEVGIVLGEARLGLPRRFGRGDLTRKHGKQGRTITRNGESRLAELLLRPGTVSGKRRVGPGHRLLRNPDASSSY